jgi:hypothetical protein
MSTANIQAFSGDVSVGGGLNISGSVTSTAGIDKVTLAEDATDASRRILFTTGSTGAQPLKTDAGIVYNPSTNTLTAGVFSGSGASITTLNGSNISSGTVAAARVATLNQNTTGSAATLTTARTIGGVSFNGSAAINLPGVNIAGNQNTSGSASSAGNADTVDGQHAHEMSWGHDTAHATYSDFNTFLNTDKFGAHFAAGTTNGPGQSGATQYYHQRMSLGSQYNNYSLQLAIGRGRTDNYLWYRNEEADTPTTWYKMRAGYADSAGSATSATTAGNADTVDNLHASSFLRSDADDTVGAGVTYTWSATDIQGLVFKNASYNAFLYVGGWSTTNSNDISRIRTSGGNLHMDSAANGSIYLNWYTAGSVQIGSDTTVTGALTATGIITCSANKMVIAGGSPTLYLRDSNARTGMIHQNDGIMYFLSGVAGSDSWSQVNGVWPLSLNCTNNAATFGGTVTAPTFSGALSGNATTATTAGSITSQANSATITASASAGNNTIVQRHASGYIYANYFNTTPNDVTSGVTKVCIESGNDGFIRHGTAAAIKTFIGAPTTFFNAADNNVAIGNFAGSSSQGSTAVAIGYEAGKTSQGTYAVAVGREAGETSQSSYGIAIGRLAGSSSQFGNAIAIGRQAGQTSQEEEAVAIGYQAGLTNQRGRTVAIGYQTGYLRQSDQSVALGTSSGRTDQGYRGISLGYRSAYSAQGSYGIAIGYQAGYSSQPANTFYVATNSVRSQGGSYNMRYNTTTGEVSYTSSDDRVKDGETLITDAVKTLSKLRPQNYFKRTKLDPNAPEQNWYHESGLMAQEVYYSVPEMRHLVLIPPEAGDIDKYTPPPSDDPSQDPDYSVWGDGIASVDYMQMVPYLVKGVQEIVTELPRSKTTVSNTWGQNITGLVVSANTNKHKTNTVPIVNISTVSMDKSWYGVVSSDKTDSIEYDTLVDTKGDSRIWVTDTNGTLESGDLLTTSNVAPGYTQKQEGGALMNYTVAKVTQDCDFTEPLQVSIKIPKRELSNVMYYIHDESYEISLDDYEKRPSFKTSVEEIPIYFKEVVDGGETIYYQGDMEISSLKYDSLPDDAIKSVKHLHEISVEEYNTLDAVEKATYSLGTSKTYKAIQFSKSKKQIPQHDEVRILEELVDVLDENGQTVWEETGETKPVYTLVDHGTYKAALVSCKLI